jgi:hypothetical protein
MLVLRPGQQTWEHQTFETRGEAESLKAEIHGANYPDPVWDYEKPGEDDRRFLTRKELVAEYIAEGVPYTKSKGPFKIDWPIKKPARGQFKRRGQSLSYTSARSDNGVHRRQKTLRLITPSYRRR